MRVVATVLLILLSCAPALGVELLPPGAPSPGRGLWFDIPTAVKILTEIEGCRAGQGMLESCQETVDNGDRIIREQEGRILELERDVTRLEEMNKDALDAAKRVSGGKWYERVLSAGKWIALGTLVGFAIGAAQ